MARQVILGPPATIFLVLQIMTDDPARLIVVEALHIDPVDCEDELLQVDLLLVLRELP